MKHCNTCKKDKDKSEFGNRAASLDGLSPKCKQCQSAYDKARLRDPKRMAARLAYQRSPKGKESHNKACAKWAEKNVIKRSAHILVGNAVRKGDLSKMSCEICGCDKSNAHHDDYSKPLEVRWLCDLHHKDWHNENGEGLNAQ